MYDGKAYMFPWLKLVSAIAVNMDIFKERNAENLLPLNRLIYAAKIDGCNEWMIYMCIILPMSVPVVGIIAIFSFITQWNDFLWPMIVTSSKQMRTLPIGLASMQQMNSTDYGYLMAGSVFASIPIVVIFLSFSKYFVKGLSLGGVKG